ncbi:MAG: efflux RND transporter permease subunit [Alphaproteobacteria bacterium]|nr:efflux RND transporter permease subunit [Alphaproteobacteria bacterium]
MWFTRVSLQNPVFATMVMLALVVLGLFSYQQLKIDQFPNIDFPVVVVTTDYPGAAPEIVESEVSKKIEEGVNSIAGINALTSRSYEGVSVVVIEFQLHINGRKAADDVREKVAAIRPSLRDEVKEPRVLRFDPSSRAIWSLAVLPDPAGAGPAGVPDTIAMTQWADQVLKRRLENVRGVGVVNVVGGTKRQIQIQLNPQAMNALGITSDQVAQAVRTENQDFPLGTVRASDRERVLQIEARMKRPEDFKDIIVARRGNQSIRLGHVANVVDGPQELENMALYNGDRTLLLTVQKAQDENTIDVIDGLNKSVKVIETQLPAGMRLEPIYDGSRMIRVSVNNVRRTLIEGAALTVLIVFLFLNSWRSTVITGLALPIAIIGSFLFMHALGFTINMVTLMALSLCVGLLIDDAIVVRENIVRHVQMGKSAYQAAMDGTQEIGLAVLATTLSIVAVFLPIGFMQGIIGKFFHEFGLTIVVAVLISMFVSFTLDPMLSSIWHDPSIHRRGGTGQGGSLYERTLGRLTLKFEQWTERLGLSYQNALAWALVHKKKTLLAALVIFATSIWMVRFLGTEFVPKADFSETSVNFNTPVGSSIELTEAKARQVDAILREWPEVRYTLTTINTGSAQGKIYASVYVRLVDRQHRTRSLEDIVAEFRQRLAQVPGITVTHAGQLDVVGGNKQIEFSLTGPDLKELERLSLRLMDQLRSVSGLVDLDSSVKPDKPTLDVVVDRSAAAESGLSVGTLGSQLRRWVAGETLGNWRAPDDQTYDVIVRLPASGRNTEGDIAALPIALPSPISDGSSRVIRLDQVAQVIPSTGPNQINRRDLLREVSMNGNASGRSAGEISADVRRAMAEIDLPPGYAFQFSGSTKNMQESFGYALSALAMAVIFIYMILASQFKSFLQPLALMTSLPLTLIGVVAALLMFRSTLSMFSIIGVVMLMGLVTKNAILLVDFAIRAREGLVGDGSLARPLNREEALLLAARVRLRPILMTTLAMIFGMVPLAFALTEGSEQRAPMGQAVIGGVITSSILTLVVVPVVYCYLDDLSQWLKRRLGVRQPDKDHTD